jgi:ubiquinone biosynthesis protein UbiJ
VSISGDTELGQRFQEFMRALDIDWEEQLSRVSGDIVAHKVGNTVRGFFAWGAQTANSIRQDVREYLQYESHVLPDTREVMAFATEVDKTRDHVERLQARINRLAGKISPAKKPTKPRKKTPRRSTKSKTGSEAGTGTKKAAH